MSSDRLPLQSFEIEDFWLRNTVAIMQAVTGDTTTDEDDALLLLLEDAFPQKPLPVESFMALMRISTSRGVLLSENARPMAPRTFARCRPRVQPLTERHLGLGHLALARQPVRGDDIIQIARRAFPLVTHSGALPGLVAADISRIAAAMANIVSLYRYDNMPNQQSCLQLPACFGLLVAEALFLNWRMPPPRYDRDAVSEMLLGPEGRIASVLEFCIRIGMEDHAEIENSA